MQAKNNHLIKSFETTLSCYFNPNNALLSHTESLSSSGPKSALHYKC